MNIQEVAAKSSYRPDIYERGFPDYPREAIEFLRQIFGIKQGTSILDLGAGTGKFTKAMSELTENVIAVDPVAKMRKEFQELHPALKILDACAEQIPLPSESIDVVTAAQAFHWFDGKRAVPEISRVLKKGGKIALLWNRRDENADWQMRLTKIIDKYALDAPRYRSMLWKNEFLKTDFFGEISLRTFNNVQVGTRQTVLDRISGMALIAALDDGPRNEALDRVKHLLETHADTKEREEIEIPYRTVVYFAEKI